MLLLSLDTSGDVCSLCVSDDAQIRALYQFRHERRLNERLPDIASFVLRDAQATLHDIDGFAVGLGPGSFTGVRVGVTLIKTWAFALNRPVVGVSSLDALALPLANAPVARIAVAPTRRTEVIAAFYAPGQILPVAPPNDAIEDGSKAIFSGGEVIAHVDVVRVARERLGLLPLIVCGEVAEAVLAVTEDADRVSADPTPITVANIVRLALPCLLRGEADETHTLEPLYVTPTPVG